MASRPIRLSVITPAYNEEENLPILHERLMRTLGGIDCTWEWIVIDDHSSDGTFRALQALAASNPSICGVRLARNVGAHLALACGLSRATGDCAVILAADLQDPPELIPDLIDQWRDGAQIVWGIRRGRPGDSAMTRGFSRLYFYLMRNFVGLDQMPPTGSDFFLVDHQVVRAFEKFSEANVTTMGLLTWLGFRQEVVAYDKSQRQHGTSGWSLERKLKILVDSITAFTYKPIRIMTYAGVVVGASGIAYGGFVAFNALVRGSPVQGYASLMVAVLVLGGMQMLMLGVLGEYLWRALDEARKRPRFVIEATTKNDDMGAEY